MSIPLTGSGGYFTRFGHLLGLLTDIQPLLGGPATARVLSGASAAARYTTFETDFAASPAIHEVLDGFFAQLTGFQNQQRGFLSTLSQLSQKTLVAMAVADTPLLSQTASA